MLVGRTLLFAGWQAVLAAALFVLGSPAAWEASAAWWPLAVTLANLVGLALLLSLFRTEGRNYWDIFRIRREDLKGDVLALLGTLVIAGPVSYLPNVLLANWLFGDPQEALDLLVRPLPLWAAYAGLVLFPVTQGLVEIPTYFAYVMPRLESQGSPRWLAVALPALALGLQHIAVPLVFDLHYIAWRALMFIPFAFLVGLVLRWRPSLLPYLAVVHVLMDMFFAAMFLSVAY
jgi:hypothetical protein